MNPSQMAQEGLSYLRGRRYEKQLHEDAVIKSVLLRDMRKKAVLERAMVLIAAGFTGREAGRLLNLNRMTTCKLRKRMMAVFELKCGCGGEHGHKGWCNWRLNRSRARTLTLLKMHISQKGKKRAK